MTVAYLDRCRQLADRATVYVSVTLVHREGSVPTDVGSKMIVTADGYDFGTIGGGRVEAKAIEHALAMLRDKRTNDLVQWNLTTDVGMTCGGRLRLFFERVDVATWPIVVFGAGHVSQALIGLLVSLPCQVTCIDPRTEWLDKLPASVLRICSSSTPELIASLDDASYVVSMTQGHSHDLPVLKEIWKQKKQFPFIGVIGSKSKAGALRRELDEAGMPAGAIEFHCPIGMPIGSNHPGEIAVSIAAQLLQVRDTVVA